MGGWKRGLVPFSCSEYRVAVFQGGSIQLVYVDFASQLPFDFRGAPNVINVAMREEDRGEFFRIKS